MNIETMLANRSAELQRGLLGFRSCKSEGELNAWLSANEDKPLSRVAYEIREHRLKLRKHTS